MDTKEHKKTIVISQRVKDKLDKLGKKGMTYNEIISKLVNLKVMKGGIKQDDKTNTI